MFIDRQTKLNDVKQLFSPKTTENRSLLKK